MHPPSPPTTPGESPPRTARTPSQTKSPSRPPPGPTPRARASPRVASARATCRPRTTRSMTAEAPLPRRRRRSRRRLPRARAHAARRATRRRRRPRRARRGCVRCIVSTRASADADMAHLLPTRAGAGCGSSERRFRVLLAGGGWSVSPDPACGGGSAQSSCAARCSTMGSALPRRTICAGGFREREKG
jgi:hypothetical protein